MSGGGGHVIIGDKPLADQVKDNISLVAPFRRQHALSIIALYEHNENAVTRDQQQFLLRCAADIVDSP